ncbi:MAG: hypothetical protein AB1757_09685 [Acidobacteriota bacterium]
MMSVRLPVYQSAITYPESDGKPTAETDYLSEPLIAYRLEDGKFVEVEIINGRLRSNAPGLDIVDTGKTLRLVNPKTKKFLLTPDEAMEAVQSQQAKSTGKKSTKSPKK